MKKIILAFSLVLIGAIIGVASYKMNQPKYETVYIVFNGKIDYKLLEKYHIKDVEKTNIILNKDEIFGNVSRKESEHIIKNLNKEKELLKATIVLKNGADIE